MKGRKEMNYNIVGYITDNRDVKYYLIDVISPEASTTNYGIKTVGAINKLRAFEQVKRDITTLTDSKCMTPCTYDRAKNKIEFPDNIKKSLIKTNFAYFDSIKLDKLDQLVNNKVDTLVTQGGIVRSYCIDKGIPLYWSGWLEAKSGTKYNIAVQKMFNDRFTIAVALFGPGGKVLRDFTVKGLTEVVNSLAKIYKYA